MDSQLTHLAALQPTPSGGHMHMHSLPQAPEPEDGLCKPEGTTAPLPARPFQQEPEGPLLRPLPGMQLPNTLPSLSPVEGD